VAVFRIEKTQNYTVMSNHHLRNKALTLKAKGLLSQILSLPENWDYTLAGLSHINREKIDAIREAVRELEAAGYITRLRVRDDKGHLKGTEYIIHEQPQDSPILDFPTLDNPTLEKPTQDNPTLDNPTQLNKEKVITEKAITDLSNTDSIPFTSPREAGAERNGTEADSISVFEIYREIIHENIEYPFLLENNKYDHDRINEIVDLMLETVCTVRKP